VTGGTSDPRKLGRDSAGHGKRRNRLVALRLLSTGVGVPSDTAARRVRFLHNDRGTAPPPWADLDPATVYPGLE